MGVVGARGPHTREDPSHPFEQGGVETSRRVVVVDDHELIRSGTKQILDDATGFNVVGEAEDRDGAPRVIAEAEPDVVLVGIRLPTVNGIDLAREIVAGFPRAKVLILSAYDDD